MSAQRVFFHILCILFLSLFFSAAGLAGPLTPPDYRKIPGITPDEIARVERLKAQRLDGLVYAMTVSEEAFLNARGEVGGFTRLLCEHLSRMFGLKITPRLLPWDKLLAGLSAREIDLSGDLTPTEERLQRYHMSAPIAERPYMLFHSALREDINLISGGTPLRYGFLVNSVTFGRVHAVSQVPFTPVFVNNYAEAAAAIRNDTIDAFIAEAMMNTRFGDFPGIVSKKYYPVTYTRVSLCTQNPEVYPLIDVFQKYLAHGGADVLADMYDQGWREYLRHKLYGQLTAEEKAYIAEHGATGKAIPLAAEFDHYPLSFYNKQEKAWQGVAHDIFAEISALTGLTFAPVNGPDEAWASLLRRLESGEAAVITELLPSRDRAGRFLWAKEPYTVDNYVLLSRSDTADIAVNHVHNVAVGLIGGTAYEEMFYRVFTGHGLVKIYPDSVAAFAGLEKGEVGLVMMSENLLLSITNYSEQPGFKINISLDLPCNSYFGFHLKEEVLRSIVEKAQSLVDCRRIASRWTHKVFDYDKKLAQAKVPYLVGICILLLLVLLLVVVLFGKKDRLARRLIMTDHLTLLPNRRSFEERLLAEWEQAIKNRLCLSLLTIDVDHFKQYNDTYGHPEGDNVLRAVARIFARAVARYGDMAARSGGEEFSIILPNTEPGGAMRIAENIRAQVANKVMETADGQPTRVTVSIGVASARPGPGDALAGLVGLSDKALYTAKQAGRNRVCLASDNGPPDSRG